MHTTIIAEGTDKQRLLRRLDTAWAALKESYAGLSDARLTEPGVTGDGAVKDILAHVTTWEREALKHLPLIIAGGRPPRYVSYGGIDAFNAKMTEEKRGLSLSEVLRQLEDTHGHLIDFVRRTSEGQFTRDTRFRRRLRLDTATIRSTPRQYGNGGSSASATDVASLDTARGFHGRRGSEASTMRLWGQTRENAKDDRSRCVEPSSARLRGADARDVGVVETRA